MLNRETWPTWATVTVRGVILSLCALACVCMCVRLPTSVEANSSLVFAQILIQLVYLQGKQQYSQREEGSFSFIQRKSTNKHRDKSQSTSVLCSVSFLPRVTTVIQHEDGLLVSFRLRPGKKIPVYVLANFVLLAVCPYLYAIFALVW